MSLCEFYEQLSPRFDYFCRHAIQAPTYCYGAMLRQFSRQQLTHEGKQIIGERRDQEAQRIGIEIRTRQGVAAKIQFQFLDSAFDNLFVPQPSWSPSTTQQLRKLVAAPYLSPNDWTPRLDAYFASPLALCARRVSSAASRLLGTTSLRFALHGWQRQRVHS